MAEPLYYAKEGLVRKRSIVTEHADGGQSMTLDFPVCIMHDAVGPDQAGTIAGLMNEGHNAGAAKGELVRALEELHALVMGESPSLLNEDSGGDAQLDIEICALLDKHRSQG